MGNLGSLKIDEGSIYLIISPVGATDLHRQFLHIGHAKDPGRRSDRCSLEHRGRVYEWRRPGAIHGHGHGPAAQATAVRTSQSHSLHEKEGRKERKKESQSVFLALPSPSTTSIVLAHASVQTAGRGFSGIVVIQPFSSRLSAPLNESVQSYYLKLGLKFSQHTSFQQK